jgi:hypothetical protein
MSIDGRWGRLRAAVALIAAGVAVGAQMPDLLRLRTARQAAVAALRDEARGREAAERAGQATRDTLVALGEATRARDSLSTHPYLVVSVADNRLWLRVGDSVLFEAPVATGRGSSYEDGAWRFATPHGRLRVERKEVEPLWVPPDWHYEEVAETRRLRLVRLRTGETIPLADGAELRVSGRDVVRRSSDGREVPYPRGTEIVVGTRLIVPPFGTNQRLYPDVLGSNRLYLGDGYGIHGTNDPASIGQSVTHGCIRMRNEDMLVLFPLVPAGTPVYIY